MQIHVKALTVGLILAVGAWCILWNPIEYLDRELGTTGLTILGLLILFVAWIFWRKKAF